MTTPDLSDLPPARLDIPVLRAYRQDVVAVRADSADGDEDVRYLEGHFSVFNRWFEINSWFEGHFLERTVPGSFVDTFNAWRSADDPHRIQVLLEHGYDPTVGDKPLAVNESLNEDKIGAAYRARLFDAAYVRELLPALEAGVYGSSYRFRVVADSWDYEPGTSDHNPDGIPERTITAQAVFEHGPTVFPANPDATAGLRSATDRYYEQVRSRNPRSYDRYVRRATKLRSSIDINAGVPLVSAGAGPAVTESMRCGPRHASQVRRRLLAQKWSSQR